MKVVYQVAGLSPIPFFVEVVEDPLPALKRGKMSYIIR